MGESATLTAIDAIADSEALPLGTTAVAQVLAALDASKALPLSTLAAGSLPVVFDHTGVLPLTTSVTGSAAVALDSLGSLPLGQVVDMSLGDAPAATLDSAKGLPLRTFGELESAPREEEGITLGRRPFAKTAIAFVSQRRLPMTTVAMIELETAATPPALVFAIAPAVPRAVVLAPLATAPEPKPVPVKAQPVRWRSVSRIASESRLPLGTQAAATVAPFPVSQVDSGVRLPLKMRMGAAVIPFPELTLDYAGVLPLRTSASLSLEPVVEPVDEDDDLDVILLAYDFMQAA